MPDYTTQQKFTSSWLTPELVKQPSLAYTAANTPEPKTTGHVISMAAKGTNTANAIAENIDENGNQSFWDGVLKTVTQNKTSQFVFEKLAFLGKPLEEVSKDYKFLHSVWTDHGAFAGLLATTGVIAGGVGGALVGGAIGAKFGAEAVGYAERKLLGQNMWKDSYAKSEDPNYEISFGRDFSNALAVINDGLGGPDAVSAALRKTDEGWGKTVSGLADLTFDFSADPLMVLGKASQMMREGRFLASGTGKAAFEVQAKYPLAQKIAGVNNFLQAQSLRALTPTQIDLVRQGVGGVLSSSSRMYNRALDTIANQIKMAPELSLARRTELIANGKAEIAQKISDAKQMGTPLTDAEIKALKKELGNRVAGASPEAFAAGAIAYSFKELGTAAAGHLGSFTRGAAKKTTEQLADDVHEFFKTQLFFGELQGTLAGGAVLPTRTLLRSKFATPTAEAIRDAGPNWAQKIYKTFTGYMPFSVDPITQELSRSKFRWDTPDATSVVYRIGRFGMGHQAAIEMAGQYAVAVAVGDQALARIIKNQTMFESFKAMGLPDDNMFVKAVKDELDALNAPRLNSTYGVAPDGRVIAEYTTKSGKTANGGIGGWQAADEFSIPNYEAVRKSFHEAGGLLNNIGKMDDWLATHYTDQVFKPLALATMGFGLRVSAAEMMQTFARFGFKRNARAMMAAWSAKAGKKFVDGQESHFAAALGTALGLGQSLQGALDSMRLAGLMLPVVKETNMLKTLPVWEEAQLRGLKLASKMLPGEYYDLAGRLIARHGGSLTSAPVNSGHGGTGSESFDLGNTVNAYYQREKSRIEWRETGGWEAHSANDKQFIPRFKNQLQRWSKEPLGKNVSNDFLDMFPSVAKVVARPDNPEYVALRNQLINAEMKRMDLTRQGQYKDYKYESTRISRWKDQDTRGFAEDRVDTILGLAIGRDGTVNRNVLEALAGRSDQSVLEIAQNMPLAQRPLYVAGSDFEPYVGKNWYNHLIDVGFKKLVDPIVNNLSREPLYLMHVADEYKALEYSIKSGLIDEEMALHIAENRAIHAMLPQIHNTALRNQFSRFFRNVMPFYFAQEQALRRTFYAMRDTSTFNPLFSTTFRMYQMTEHVLSDPAFVTSDSSGNKYVNIPIVGEFGVQMQRGLQYLGVNMVSGLPVSVSGNLSSLASVLPEMQLPGVAPIVAIPANVISSIWPTAPAIISDVFAGKSANRGVWDILLPNTMLKTAWKAMTLDERDTAVSNAILSSIASAAYHNQIPGPNASPMEIQDWLESIRNNAKSILVMKAALSLISPLSPKVEQVDPGLREEFLNLVHSKGYEVAALEFLNKYGNNAVGYTVSKTESSSKGANIPLVQDSLAWLEQHKDIVHGNGTSLAAPYLIPQQEMDDPNKFLVYDELLKQNIRIRRAPKEFLEQIYISSGYVTMQPKIDEHKRIVNELTSYGDNYGLKQEADRWSVEMDNARKTMPIWYASYTSGAGGVNAQQVVEQFRNIFSLENAPTNQQALEVKALLSDYDAHVAAVNAYDSYGDVEAKRLEKQNWEVYLMNVVAKNPLLTSVVNSVFAKLD